MYGARNLWLLLPVRVISKLITFTLQQIKYSQIWKMFFLH
jgi:hypothetical protein